MKNLLTLAAGSASRAQDFEYFEYDHVFRNADNVMLRLHMRNQATLEIPANDQQLIRLMYALMSGFRPEAVAFLKKNSWI